MIPSRNRDKTGQPSPKGVAHNLGHHDSLGSQLEAPDSGLRETAKLAQLSNNKNGSAAVLGAPNALSVPVQRNPTPGEKFAEKNPDAGEDVAYALIGTDNEYASPLAMELEECVKQGMALPAYLAKFLKDNEKSWSPELNDLWMKEMTSERKIFVLLHPKIQTLLAKSDEHFFQEAKTRKSTGTWREVEILLKQGYTYYARAGILLPPDLAPEAYDKWQEARKDASEKLDA